MGQKVGILKRIFSCGYRSDGSLVQDLDPTQKIVPYFMKSRQASSVYLCETYDMTQTLQYIEKHDKCQDSERYSLFVILIAALVRTGVLHPKLNRFVVGKRIYSRNLLQASFTIKKELSEDGKEMVIKLTFQPSDTITEVAAKVNEAVKRARGKQETGKSDNLINRLLMLPSPVLSIIFYLEKYLNHWGLLPHSIMDADPLFASAFIANLGSLAIGAPYHPLYERGTISIFVVLGKYRDVKQIGEDGHLACKKMADVSFTVDSRIADGYSIAQAMQSFKVFMENPHKLEV